MLTQLRLQFSCDSGRGSFLLKVSFGDLPILSSAKSFSLVSKKVHLVVLFALYHNLNFEELSKFVVPEHFSL